MFNPFLLEPQIFQGRSDPLPDLFASFAFGQVQFRNQFTKPLQRDRFAILVIVLDYALLVGGSLFHEKTAWAQEDKWLTMRRPLNVFDRWQSDNSAAAGQRKWTNNDNSWLACA